MSEESQGHAAVFDRLGNPVLALDSEQRIVLANAAAERLFGADCRGQHLVSRIRQPSVLRAVSRVLEGRDSASAVWSRRRPLDGRYQVRVRALAGGAGAPGRAVAMLEFSDRTQIELADRMRRDFVANVSHELRSPLTALSGFIETLQGPAADDAAAREAFLKTMSDEAARMKRLIDDLLSLSRVEASERVRPKDPVDLCALLKSLLKTLAPLAERQGCTMTLSGGEAPAMVPGDRDQLTQVFANLTENALKYAPGAPVEVALSLVEETESRGTGPAYRVTIRDHGPGIAAQHIPRLSERFYRVDDHRSRGLGGTGLGLAIVKHIVSRHRGRLSIDSKEGEGSRFTVFLPRGSN